MEKLKLTLVVHYEIYIKIYKEKLFQQSNNLII